jgi:hypothetical protein
MTRADLVYILRHAPFIALTAAGVWLILVLLFTGGQTP